MVMDLVTGGELFDAVAAEGRLSEDRTRSYFQQLIDGVAYCHSRRVYHRDLKPENLLLSGDKQTLKITDFGLSSIKAQNASTELLHTIMGSPHYIAPEIITSAAEGYEGSKVDVWAGGIILFGMLAGFLPFDHSNTRDLYRAIVYSPVKYPPHFSYDVIKLLRSMLHKDPSKRPSMAQVKAFTWFKVNYEPVLVSDAKPSTSGNIGPRKKSKNKIKRGAEQLSKRKTKEAATRASDASKNNASNSQSTVDEQCSSSLDSKPISKLFADSKSANSESEHAQEQHAPTSLDSINNPSDQENVDPKRGKVPVMEGESENQHFQMSLEKGSSRLLLLTSHLGPEHTTENSAHVEASHQSHVSQYVQTVDNNFKITTERTPEKVHIGSVEMLSPDYSDAKSVNLFTNIDDDRSPRVPPGSEQPITSIFISDSAPCPKTPQANGAQNAKNPQSLCTFSSPLSPEVQRTSSASSNSSHLATEEKRQEFVKFAGHFSAAKSSSSSFVSPIPLYTRVSSGSLHELDNKKLPLSSDHRSSVPQLFGPPSGGGAEDNHEVPEFAADAECKTERESEISEAGFASAVADASSSGPFDNKGIFKPIKSTFAPLAKQADDGQIGPSMWASVFCPEFDYDADGSPQWCIDNMEVFADAESDETRSLVKAPKRRNSKIIDDVLKQRQHSAEDEPVKPKALTSIFAPLDNDLVIKLSPCAKNAESNPFM